MKRIRTTYKFDRQFDRLPKYVQKLVLDILISCVEEGTFDFHRSHILHKEYAGYSSIDITDDYRAVFRENSGGILFDAVGTHRELYGR